jgi:hypothetical protein
LLCLFRILVLVSASRAAPASRVWSSCARMSRSRTNSVRSARMSSTSRIRVSASRCSAVIVDLGAASAAAAEATPVKCERTLLPRTRVTLLSNWNANQKECNGSSWSSDRTSKAACGCGCGWVLSMLLVAFVFVLLCVCVFLFSFLFPHCSSYFRSRHDLPDGPNVRLFSGRVVAWSIAFIIVKLISPGFSACACACACAWWCWCWCWCWCWWWWCGVCV